MRASNTSTITFLPVNRTTMMVELENLDLTLTLYDQLMANPHHGIIQIIPAARTLMVHFDPAKIDREALIKNIKTYDLSQKRPPSHEIIEIPVHYNGEDLEDVANILGISIKELIALHTSSQYSVAFTGFAPGFAYLTGGHPKLDVPRRKVPRTQIPAGSVGLAGTFSGVYPQASPGGWQLLGITQMPMFDIDRDPPVLLQPGYGVRFYDADAGSRPSVSTNAAHQPIKPTTETKGTKTFVVTDSATPVLFQDFGRPQKASQGISPSGAVDMASYCNANRLVGNPQGKPALEITLGNFGFEVLEPAVIGLCGAPVDITLRNKNGIMTKAGCNQPIALDAGDHVKIGNVDAGVRTYLALRGGFKVKSVMTSASRDTLANVGPTPLSRNVCLYRDDDTHLSCVETSILPAFTMPRTGEVVELDVIMGPRSDWFTEEALTLFATQHWRVTPQSNRIGCRLEGDVPLQRKNDQELPSEGTATGAIQIPAAGQPVLFLADRPLTGGYPVIANIAEYHLDLAGQLPVGAYIHFRPVTRFPNFYDLPHQAGKKAP